MTRLHQPTHQHYLAKPKVNRRVGFIWQKQTRLFNEQLFLHELKSTRDKNMQRKFKKILVLPAVVLLSSCAGFQEHKLPIVQDAEYKAEKVEKIKLYSHWKIEDSGVLVNQAAAVSMYKKSFDKAVSESGCCEIVESPAEATLVIDATAIDHSNTVAIVPAVITGLSLYTIPSWVTQTIELKIDAKSGVKENSYQLSDSFTLVQWLPMAFAFPFKGGPIANTDELNSNTYKNLIVRLKNDGYL